MTPLLLPVGAWGIFAAEGTVDWSPTVNTFLLVVLALIGLYGERARRRDADRVSSRLRQEATRVSDRLAEARDITREEMKANTALTAEVHSSLTGDRRSSELRTRNGD